MSGSAFVKMIGGRVLLCGSRGPAAAGTVSVTRASERRSTSVASTDHRQSPITLRAVFRFDLYGALRGISQNIPTPEQNSKSRNVSTSPISSRDPQGPVPRERWDGGPNDLRWTQWMLQYAILALSSEATADRGGHCYLGRTARPSLSGHLMPGDDR